MATATATKARPKAPATKVAPLKIDTPTAWAVAVLVEMNKQLPKNQRIPITVQNVETMLRPISGEGTVGQQGGFLRDNNPWNVGTFCGAHGPLYGAIKTVAPYGPDSRCGGGSVYLNVFATPLAGAKGTAAYLLQYSNYKAMRLNAPASIVFKGTSYGGEASAPPAASPTQAQVTSLALRLGDAGAAGGSGALALLGPSATLTTAEAKNARSWLQALAPEYKAATGTTLKVPTLAQLEAKTMAQAVAEIQAVFAPIQKGTSNDVPSASLIEATLGQGGASTAGAATLEGPNLPNPLAGLSAIGQFFGDLTSVAFWQRVGIGVLGLGLVIGGAALFLQSTKTIQSIEGKVA